MVTQREIENFIYSSHKEYFEKERPPVTDDIGRFPQLTRILLNTIGVNDTGMKNIVVTGSKGKGSVTRMVAVFLKSLGYKVGVFTSPHHYDYRERICIDGVMISKENFVEHGKIVRNNFNKLKIDPDEYISPMGLSVSIALSYFESMETDFNILECGRGGRFDDINQVDHEYAVINQVFVEHKEYLGDTIESVCYHKSGIITDSVKKVFLNDQKPLVKAFVQAEAEKQHTEFIRMNKNDYLSFKSNDRGICIMTNKGGIQLPVFSGYTADNLSFSLKIVESITDKRIALTQKLIDQMTFKGSLSKVMDEPKIFIDGCIHLSSLKRIMVGLPKASKRYVISGVSMDKDYINILDYLKDHFDGVFASKPSMTHHHFITDYKGVRVFDELKECINTTFDEIEKDDLLLIIGIQGFIAEAKRLLEDKK